jgi:transcriptional regulator with XRE-family HTH domain
MSPASLTPDSLAILVRRQRQARGLTQRELAQRSGLCEAAVGHIETGFRADPHASTVAALARALGIEPGALLAVFQT